MPSRKIATIEPPMPMNMKVGHTCLNLNFSLACDLAASCWPSHGWGEEQGMLPRKGGIGQLDSRGLRTLHLFTRAPKAYAQYDRQNTQVLLLEFTHRSYRGCTRVGPPPPLPKWRGGSPTDPLQPLPRWRGRNANFDRCRRGAEVMQPRPYNCDARLMRIALDNH